MSLMDDFSLSPMWVQIHNMLIGCMNRAVGIQIGSLLGKVEDVAVAEDDVGWGHYLRVRVAINLFLPLERGRKLFIAGNSCWVSFKYEKLPVFCFKCGCIIHGPKGCCEINTRKLNHGENTEGWGSWLRADDLSKRTGMYEGRKAEDSSSPAWLGHRQTKDFPMKGNPKKEREPRVVDAEASAESFPNPNLESRLRCPTLDPGDTHNGNRAKTKEIPVKQDLKIPEGLSQLSGSAAFPNSGDLLYGKVPRVKGGGKGKKLDNSIKARDGNLNVQNSVKGLVGESGKATRLLGPPRLSYQPKYETVAGRENPSLKMEEVYVEKPWIFLVHLWFPMQKIRFHKPLLVSSLR